jgi:hemoglobin
MTTGRSGGAPYRRTRTFTELTLPQGLRAEHRTRAGVRAEVVVERGQVDLVFPGPPPRRHQLSPTTRGHIPPGEPHHLEIQGEVALHVAFFHTASSTS